VPIGNHVAVNEDFDAWREQHYYRVDVPDDVRAALRLDNTGGPGHLHNMVVKRVRLFLSQTYRITCASFSACV
jgi:hypothetical protein